VINKVKDYREWLNLLEANGELHRIRAEVDWNEEIGAITRMVMSARGPALLFENIKGYKHTLCRKILTAGLGNYNRIALLLGLEKGTPPKEIVEAYREGLRKRIPPKEVTTGPVKKNIIKGNDIDLFQIPVPKWHNWDGGRYINTFQATITRDPETGLQNVGIYRGMLTSKNKISTLLALAQHWGQHFIKHRDIGTEMPVAFVYGAEPLVEFLALSPIQHYGYSELDVVGGIKGEPIEVIKCETSDIRVPANAEIIIEGTISSDPSTYEIEGPFAEHTGYYGGGASPKPVVNVKCVTYRDDPIFRGSMEGNRPGWPTENSFPECIAMSAAIWKHLQDCGIPGVTDVWLNPVGTYLNIFVQIRKSYRGHAKEIASAIWGQSSAYWCFKNVMVVEEDIDIRDYEQLEWAFAFRVNAREDDIVMMPGTFGSVLDPSCRLEERDIYKYGSGKWTRVLIDATRNWEFERWEAWNKSVYPPIIVMDKKLEDYVKSRWDEYGLSEIEYKPTMRIDVDEDIKYRYSLSARPTKRE